MQALLAFFTRYFHWVVFLVLEAVSGVMLFRYNSYQGSVWLSSANAVAGKVYDWSSSVSHFFTLTRINEELTGSYDQFNVGINNLRRRLAILYHGECRTEFRNKAEGGACAVIHIPLQG